MTNNRQMMHAAVEAAFSPDVHDQKHGTRPLWRIDQDGNRIALYILSPERPSLLHLQEQIGWEEEKTWATIEYAPILRKVTEGDRYGFRIAANPVRTVTTNGKKKRYHHVTADQQLKWLLAREKDMGVSFSTFGLDVSDGISKQTEPTVQVTNRQLNRFRRGKSQVTISVVQFDGVLSVTNPERLRGVLTDGLGPGKAYGCGLLTLAPPTVKS